METKKFEKSVTVPAPKSSKVETILVVVGLTLLGSLMAAFVVYDMYADERGAHSDTTRRYFAMKDANASLQEKLDGMKDDIKELTNDEADTLHVTNDQSRKDVMACLKQPDGILVTPWALGLPYWELKLHNPEPVLSTSPEGDYWFTPGSACGLDRSSAISITRWDDVYILRPWNPPGHARSYATCPDAAFRFVSERNEVVRNAVFRACLTKIRARDAGLLSPNR